VDKKKVTNEGKGVVNRIIRLSQEDKKPRRPQKESQNSKEWLQNMEYLLTLLPCPLLVC